MKIDIGFTVLRYIPCLSALRLTFLSMINICSGRFYNKKDVIIIPQISLYMLARRRIRYWLCQGDFPYILTEYLSILTLSAFL